MAYGKIDPDGTVTITYNPSQGDKLYAGDGQNHLLPCERCGAVVPVSLPTCSVICEDCVLCECGRRADECATFDGEEQHRDR